MIEFLTSIVGPLLGGGIALLVSLRVLNATVDRHSADIQELMRKDVAAEKFQSLETAVEQVRDELCQIRRVLEDTLVQTRTNGYPKPRSRRKAA